MKPDFMPDFGNGTEEEQIRNALNTLMQPDAVEKWLHHYNAHLLAKPIDLIKCGETDSIWHMIYDVGTGMPN